MEKFSEALMINTALTDLDLSCLLKQINRLFASVIAYGGFCSQPFWIKRSISY